MLVKKNDIIINAQSVIPEYVTNINYAVLLNNKFKHPNSFRLNENTIYGEVHTTFIG